MKKLLSLCLFLPLTCNMNPAPTPAQRADGVARAVSPDELRSDALALCLFSDLTRTQQGNIVFSPAGAETLLQMLRNGAAGQTLAEMEKLPTMGGCGQGCALQPQTAQALFVTDKVTELLPQPAAEIHRVSTASALRDINKWVQKQTKGRITAALAELPQQTALVPVSAVYLEERWLDPFGTNRTREEDFTLSNGKRVKVPMMHKEHALCRYAEGADWQAVALFYRRDGREGQPGCLIAVRPKGDARAFARSLTPAKWRQLRRALQQDTPLPTDLALPRFSTAPTCLDLSPALQRLGMRTAFTREADFSRLAQVRPPYYLYVDKVQQICCVKLNEEGTEAAAVTMAPMIGCCVTVPPQPMRRIRFDKPFIWAVTDLSTDAAPWFMGLTEAP